MPANLIKSAADERAWERAKAAVGSRYGDSDKKWATIVTIFKNIKRKKRHGR